MVAEGDLEVRSIMKKAAFTFTLAILTVGCSTSTNPASAPTKETSGVGSGVGSILRLDPAFDALVPADAHIEKLAGGFQFTEGPVWRPQEQHLWFSDVMANVVRQWSPDGKATIAIEHAGQDKDGAPGSLIGPNGEIADKDGAGLICQHAIADVSSVEIWEADWIGSSVFLVVRRHHRSPGGRILSRQPLNSLRYSTASDKFGVQADYYL